MTDAVIPADIALLAAQEEGHPIAWHYGESSVTIVFEDGRKLTFLLDLTPPPLPKPEGPGVGSKRRSHV